LKTLVALSLVAGALLLGATPAQVGATVRNVPLGVVPHSGLAPAAEAPRAAPPLNQCPPGQTPTQCNLTYHGGPVMRTNTVYAIYWMPAGGTCSTSSTSSTPGSCAGYESTIDKYFTDVAAASGSSSNVYSVATQYSDTTGSIAYDSTFGGSYVDTTAYPSSGCNDRHDPKCLTDSQLQSEIQHAISTNGWPTGTTRLFFMFTPDNVGICIDVSGTECSTNYFCAYHDSIGGSVVYAVEPDNASIPTGGCDNVMDPNSAAADPTINTASHEMNEAITDPTNGGWWNNASQQENGDNCAWIFGAPLGADYNQVINGDHYYLQEEWSNVGSLCLQNSLLSSGTPAPTNSSPPVVSGVAGAGKTLTTTTGTWNGSPTSYAYQWQQCSSSGTGCADISGATGATYELADADAGHEIRSEVSAHNDGGSSGFTPSTPTEVVAPVPATTAAPVVSGRAAVGKTLSTTQGTWNTPATYAYQWLRCSSTGTACASIPDATSSTYTVTRADRGHELGASVSATNAAATTTALSGLTAAVVGVPATSRLPAVSGKAKVGKRLSVTPGTWSGSPSSFRYQWLRCGSGGGSCVHIKGATKPTYRLTRHDARHRLRVAVTAVNVAGRSSSTSAATSVVKR
jgi:hypothetical protein